MENQKVTTGKYALNYGLILGAISIAFSLMLFFLDMHYKQSTTGTVVGILISASVIMAGLIAFRKANEGFISLSEALKLGLGITLVSLILGWIYYFVLSNLLDPEMVEKRIQHGLEQAKVENPGLSQEVLDQQYEMTKKFYWVGYIVAVFIQFLIGFLISLIGGLIIKKSKPE